MQPPPTNPGYQPNAPMMTPPKKGLGCWGWGAIVAVALIVLCGAGFFIMGRAVMNTPEFQKAYKEGLEQQRRGAATGSTTGSPATGTPATGSSTNSAPATP